MPFCYPDPTGTQSSQGPAWKLVRSIESADGSSVREYETARPYHGRMFQYRIREDVTGSYGSCRAIS